MIHELVCTPPPSVDRPKDDRYLSVAQVDPHLDSVQIDPHNENSRKDYTLLRRRYGTIEKQVSELSDLFKEVQTLVQIQGCMVDTIEENMITTRSDTVESVKELTTAKTYTDSTYLAGGTCLLIVSCPPMILLVGVKAGLMITAGLVGCGFLMIRR